MDQRTGHSQRSSEAQGAVKTEDMARVEERMQETIEGIKSTVDSALEGFKQVQDTVDGAKTAVDETIESVKATVHEAVERVQPLAGFLDYVRQNPWLLMGSAVLMGYILGSLASEKASSR
jgi:ElaB/YqjD/DUF883 family membrane-anchored ribosome-binding protein